MSTALQILYGGESVGNLTPRLVVPGVQLGVLVDSTRR